MREDRKTVRVRHETRRRLAIVRDRQFLTPNLLSIRFSSDDFGDFVSASADDHVKLFFPCDDPDGERPQMRDYTPRAFDTERGELIVDFALHDGPGPATAWAMSAQVGDQLSIGGPRGSVVIADSYDWYWLIGDETALPSIARRLTEWTSQKIAVLVAVSDASEELPIPAREDLTVEWVHRPAKSAADPTALLSRLVNWSIPPGDGFIWMAAESGVVRALRQHQLERGHPAAQLKAAGYWTRGQADAAEKFE